MQRHSEGIEPGAGPAADPLSSRSRRLVKGVGLPALFYGLFVALVAAITVVRPAALEERIEGRLLDWRFSARNAYSHFARGKAHGPPAVLPPIRIVTFDITRKDWYGSWSWSPGRVAELIEKIGSGGPRAIGIDLSLHEWGLPGGDAQIAGALVSAQLRGKAAAVGLRPAPQPAAATDQPPAGAITHIDRPERLLPHEAPRAFLTTGPIAEATALAHHAYEADRSGNVRHEYLYVRSGGTMVPSLALQTARIANGLPQEAVRIRGDGDIQLGDTRIPADRRGRLLINCYDDNDGEGAFPRYTAATILSDETHPDVFKDAVVFIGMTGTSSLDLIGTHAAQRIAAFEKDATVAANILARDFLRDAPPAVDLLVVLAAGLAVPFLIRRRALSSLLSLLGLALGLVVVNFALFLRFDCRLALAWPLLLLIAAGGIAVPWQLAAEIRVARRMRRLFSSYVTERVLARLAADPAMARLGGERREVTILFADIRGFTSFSEQHPPEEVVGTLNEYLEAMTDVIFRWEGTVDKFIGDTILAFWGAPLPQEDHAERALRCALNICSRLDRLNAAWTAAGRPALEIGVGVTTGQVLVGNIGAEGKKMDYTVIGDQVNVCSRVEELTKEFRARILVTASTFARLEPVFAAGAVGHVAVEGLAAVAVKGKQEPVHLYRVLPLQHGAATRVRDAFAAPGA